MSNQIEELVMELAKAQKERTDFEQKFAALIRKHEILKNREKNADQSLREAVKSHFERTGETKIHEAAKIRRVKRTEYDEHTHIELAIQNGRTDLLKLQKSNFNKEVRSGSIDWAQGKEVWQNQVTIQRSLGEYLIREEIQDDNELS